jgi:hypothetical protein
MRARTLVAGAVLAAATTVGLAPMASAQPVFTGGLVNVNLSDNTVQVPIGVAANVCGVSVAVIARNLPAPVECTSRTTQDLPVRFRP